MTRQLRNFDPTFKLESVRMITERDLSISHVSQLMDIGVSSICRCMEQYEAEQQGQPGIGKPLTAEQQRIRQLEQENCQLRSDVDVLQTHRPSLPRAEVSYPLVNELQTEPVPVTQTCRLLGVSWARFYEAKRRAVALTFAKLVYICVRHS
jgi:transposase-like protein